MLERREQSNTMAWRCVHVTAEAGTPPHQEASGGGQEEREDARVWSLIGDRGQGRKFYD